MFSGIVEAVSPILFAEFYHSDPAPGLVRIWVERPDFFDDLKIGDSIATNGVCLTVESLSQKIQDKATIQFALAAETLKVLKWPVLENFQNQKVNLERSLRLGDRIHGHLVSGHVEDLGLVTRKDFIGESLVLQIQLPESVLPFVWRKGSVTLHGVSLTINQFQDKCIEVCLIPETLKRTNLSLLQVGAAVNIEPDWMARALLKDKYESQKPV